MTYFFTDYPIQANLITLLTEDDIKDLPPDVMAAKRRKLADSIAARFNHVSTSIDDDEKELRTATYEWLAQLHNSARSVLPFGLEGFQVNIAEFPWYVDCFDVKWLTLAMDDGPDCVCGRQIISRIICFIVLTQIYTLLLCRV